MEEDIKELTKRWVSPEDQQVLGSLEDPDLVGGIMRCWTVALLHFLQFYQRSNQKMEFHQKRIVELEKENTALFGKIEEYREQIEAWKHKAQTSAIEAVSAFKKSHEYAQAMEDAGRARMKDIAHEWLKAEEGREKSSGQTPPSTQN
ncbi:unnamed protein product [Cuscuta europaea]|uniref:Uncharacterized protein n=1 Tax=Cuscuta europaea TaxID=41803 RepID=A0A9P1E2X8_CUSEU|nr:unnamed protein product [Cuscuta europaea]